MRCGWTGPCGCGRCFCAPTLRLGSGRSPTVIAVSPLLRELILTVCDEPVVWDARGPIRLVAALALHEIGRAGTRPLRCRPATIRGWRGWRRRWSPIRPTRAISTSMPRWREPRCARLARLFRAETGMSFQQWRRQLRMTEALVQDRPRRPTRACRRRCRLCQCAGLWRGISGDVRHHACHGCTEAPEPDRLNLDPLLGSAADVNCPLDHEAAIDMDCLSGHIGCSR